MIATINRPVNAPNVKTRSSVKLKSNFKNEGFEDYSKIQKNPGYYGSSETYIKALQGYPPNKDNQNTGTNIMGRSLGNWCADPSMYHKTKEDFMGHHLSSSSTNQYLQLKDYG